MNNLCEEAKLFYYDFLFVQNKSEIPEQILNHISRCQNCQKNLYELKTTLTQSEFKNQHKHEKSGSPVANMLKLHFSYVDHDITCKTVKPFLPGLLDNSMKISVPTPITTHIDNCSECVQDLRKISDLNLSKVNLYRLSRLYTLPQDEFEISCSDAKADIMAFVMLAFHESNNKTLQHLCTCYNCRDAIYQYREDIIHELLRENKNTCYLSSKLTNDEVFDLVIPFEINPLQYKNSEYHQSRASHIRRCPYCLEKIQEFLKRLY